MRIWNIPYLVTPSSVLGKTETDSKEMNTKITWKGFLGADGKIYTELLKNSKEEVKPEHKNKDGRTKGSDLTTLLKIK